MKTSELLDHLAVHVLDDRADMLNGAPDSLWSDEYLIRLLNEGQRILCREAWVLEDVGNATAGTIQLIQDQKDYTIHKSVVRVLSGRLSDSDLDLIRVPYDLSRPRAQVVAPYDFFYPDFPYSDTSNRPLALSTDIATRALRVRPAPDAIAAPLQILLRVSRMPLVYLDAALPDGAPEIPEEFHLSLTDYAASEALSLPAADAALRSVAKDFQAKWSAKVEKARKDRQRAEMAPGVFKFGGWANSGQGNSSYGR